MLKSLGVALTITASLSACTSSNTPTQGASSTASGSTGSTGGGAAAAPVFTSMDQVYAQRIEWRDCELPPAKHAQCASVHVPIDYTDLSLGTTTIELDRVWTRAQRPKDDLFVNPGGPGGSGVEFAKSWSGTATGLADTYAIVGFDPRGVGSSDPVTCLGTAGFDELLAFDPTPDTEAETKDARDLVVAQGKACEAHSGPLASHMTTVETAKDLDVLRAADGQDKLNYFGASYGTFLGATYAALFPGNVGRFVLDGAVYPELSDVQMSLGQTHGFQAALDAYLDACVKKPSCPVGSSRAAGEKTVTDLLDQADAHPMKTNDPKRPLTQALAFYGIGEAMYSPDYWPKLTSSLAQALKGSGQGLLALSDRYNQRTKDGYANNQQQANTVINCLDAQVKPPSPSVTESQFVKESPVFGAIAYGLATRGCDGWPLKTSLHPPDYSATGAAPIVVIGTTRDPATIYPWAVQLSKELDSGVLVTRDGDGHTGYLQGNACVDAAINAYLAKGTVPKNGLKC